MDWMRTWPNDDHKGQPVELQVYHSFLRKEQPYLQPQVMLNLVGRAGPKAIAGSILVGGRHACLAPPFPWFCLRALNTPRWYDGAYVVPGCDVVSLDAPLNCHINVAPSRLGWIRAALLKGVWFTFNCTTPAPNHCDGRSFAAVLFLIGKATLSHYMRPQSPQRTLKSKAYSRVGLSKAYSRLCGVFK